VNPKDGLFCGNCGTPLDVNALKLREQIKSVLKEDFEDQQVVEARLTEKIATRLTEWAKLFGFFTGIPLAILFATLVIWGLSSFASINAKLSTASGSAVEAEKRARNVQQRTAALDTTSKQVAARYDQLRQDVARYESLAREVESLQQKVSKIEQRNFVQSRGLTPQLRKELDNELSGFQLYVQRLGYKTKQAKINVLIADEKQGPIGSAAYYDPDKQLVFIRASVASDPGFILREYMHSVLYAGFVQPANANTTLDRYWRFYAVESSLATYLPASFLGRPQLMFSDLRAAKPWVDPGSRGNFAFAFSKADAALASILWHLRSTTDQATLDRALFAAWLDTRAQYRDEHYVALFARRVVALLGADGARAATVLRSKGVPI
jgi:hypothetical protein